MKASASVRHREATFAAVAQPSEALTEAVTQLASTLMVLQLVQGEILELLEEIRSKPASVNVASTAEPVSDVPV